MEREHTSNTLLIPCLFLILKCTPNSGRQSKTGDTDSQALGLMYMEHKNIRLFKFMTQTWGLERRIEHYGCMVDLLSRAGLLNEAHVLVETMPLSKNIAQKLTVALDPDRAAGYLVLLSNVYASAKRWLDVAYVRQKMVQMGVNQEASRSKLGSNQWSCSWFCGRYDRTHKHESLIYEMVGEITRQAQQEGREPDTLNMLSLED